MDRCKYCRKELGDGGCKIATDANRCENAHPDVRYQDREQVSRQYKRPDDLQPRLKVVS